MGTLWSGRFAAHFSRTRSSCRLCWLNMCEHSLPDYWCPKKSQHPGRGEINMPGDSATPPGSNLSALHHSGGGGLRPYPRLPSGNPSGCSERTTMSWRQTHTGALPGRCPRLEWHHAFDTEGIRMEQAAGYKPIRRGWFLGENAGSRRGNEANFKSNWVLFSASSRRRLLL